MPYNNNTLSIYIAVVEKQLSDAKWFVEITERWLTGPLLDLVFTDKVATFSNKSSYPLPEQKIIAIVNELINSGAEYSNKIETLAQLLDQQHGRWQANRQL